MDYQVLTGNCATLGNSGAVGGTVVATLSSIPQFVQNALLDVTPVIANIDNNGDFTLTLVKGSCVNLLAKDSNNKTFFDGSMNITYNDTASIGLYLQANPPSIINAEILDGNIHTLQLHRANASAWTMANPVLYEGETGVELDTLRLKVGDGVTPWNSLVYFGNTGEPTNAITLDSTPIVPPYIEGTMYWNNIDHTLNVTTDNPDVLMQVGQELHVRVWNGTASTLLNGTAVYPVTTVGSLWSVDKADSSMEDSTIVVGIVTADIPPNSEGIVTSFGLVRDYDTSAFAPHAALYVSPTTPGMLTDIPPVPPNYSIVVARVVTTGVNGSILVRLGDPDANILSVNSRTTEKDPTGWVEPENIIVNYDTTNRTVTLTGDLRYMFQGSLKELTSPWTSSAHSAADGAYFLYSTDGLNFNWSTTVWAFTDLMVARASILASPAHQFCIREVHSLMGWRSHEEFHQTLGSYRLSGGGLTAGTYITNTATNAATTPGFDVVVLKDEDLYTTIPSWTEGTYTTAYVNATNQLVFDTASSYPFKAGASFIQYNNTITGAMVDGSNNNYYNVYQLLLPATADNNSQKYRMIMVQPQASYPTLIAAQAETPLNLNVGNLANISLEFVFYARITYVTSSGDANFGKCRIATNGITYLTGTRISQNQTITSSVGMFNPMTTAGSLITSTTGGVPIELTKGSALQVLRVNAGATALEYSEDTTRSPIAGPGSSQAFSVGALSATTGAFAGNVAVGAITNTNVVYGANQIQAWNNGAVSSLYLQYTGGNTVLNYGGGNVLVGTSTDNSSGAKLQVIGDIYTESAMGIKTSIHSTGYIGGYIAGIKADYNITTGYVYCAGAAGAGKLIGADDYGATTLLYANDTAIGKMWNTGTVTINSLIDNGTGARLQVNGNVSATAFNSLGTVAAFNTTGGAYLNGNAGSDFATLNAYLNASNGAKSLSLNNNGGPVLVNTSTDNGSGAKLQVNGGGYFGGNLQVKNGTGVGYLLVAGRSSDGRAELAFQNNTFSANYAQIVGSNAGLAFRVGTADVGSFDTSGNLLVGVTSGAYHTFSKNMTGNFVLHANNSAVSGSDLTYRSDLATENNTGSAYHFLGYTGGTSKAAIFGNGTFGSATGVYGGLSDLKLKQDIVDAGSQWDDIKSLRLRKYHFKNDPDGHLQLGLVAQEAEIVSPGLVDEIPDYEEVKTVDEDGNETTERVPTGETTKSVKYSILYLKAVGALQEAMDRIEKLEARLELLEDNKRSY